MPPSVEYAVTESVNVLPKSCLIFCGCCRTTGFCALICVLETSVVFVLTVAVLLPPSPLSEIVLVISQ